jgi:hypothetical protein
MAEGMAAAASPLTNASGAPDAAARKRWLAETRGREPTAAVRRALEKW